MKTTYEYEIMACESFASVKFDVFHLVQGQGGYNTKTAISLMYWSLGLTK